MPVPVEIAAAGRVKVVPAIAVIPAFVPKVGVASVNAFVSVIATLFAPVLVKVTAPVKSFVPCVKVITPAPALTLAVDANIVPADCVTPTPVKVKSKPTASMFAPIAKAPPVVTILAVPVVLSNAPVTFKPPALSFKLNAPLLVNAPKFPIKLLPAKVTVFAVVPIKVCAVIIPVCVTAPKRLSPATAASPNTTVPVAPTPAVIFPNAAVVASIIRTAVVLTLVVVKAPAKLIAPSSPSTIINPAPASTVPPVLVTPTPLRLTPSAVIPFAPIAKAPPPAVRVTAPVEVTPCVSVRVVPALSVTPVEPAESVMFVRSIEPPAVMLITLTPLVVIENALTPLFPMLLSPVPPSAPS